MAKLITVLGDSIARGLMYDSASSRYTVYPDTYASTLKSLGYSLKNLARVGGTIDNALEMFDRCDKQPGGRLAIELGGNDSDLNWKEVAENPDVYHEAKIPLKEFGEKLRRLISFARASELKPIVVNTSTAGRKGTPWRRLRPRWRRTRRCSTCAASSFIRGTLRTSCARTAYIPTPPATRLYPRLSAASP